MSCFSRGTRQCLTQPQCLQSRIVNFIIPLPSKKFPRRFFTSTTLQAAKKPRTAIPPVKISIPKNKPSLTPTKSTLDTAHNYQSFESRLAQKSTPTILYEAPSHTAFIVSSYTGGFFCIVYASTSFWFNYLNAPPDIAAWIPPAYGAISIAMVALGSWLILGPARIIRNITAVPRALLKTPGAQSPSRHPELMIEVRLRKMFPVPFFPARQLTVRPLDITLPKPLVPVDSRMLLNVAERRALAEAEKDKKKKALEYERTHIMSAGIRHTSRAFYGMFTAVRRAWTREGFLKLEVKGQLYKLDVHGGWALDGGKAIDRLVVVKAAI